MTTILRFVSTTCAGLIFGIVVWVLVFLSLLALQLFDGSGGFVHIPSFQGTMTEVIQSGVILGAIHGFVIAIGICFSKPDAPFRSVLFGFLTTELGLAILVGHWILYTWPPSSLPNDHLHLFVLLASWFLLVSVLFVLPTLLIGSLVAAVQEIVGQRLTRVGV